jgi:predicted DNA-binding transcriptional regulator
MPTDEQVIKENEQVGMDWLMYVASGQRPDPTYKSYQDTLNKEITELRKMLSGDEILEEEPVNEQT